MTVTVIENGSRPECSRTYYGFIAILTENNALKQRYSELEASSRIEISRLIFNLF